MIRRISKSQPRSIHFAVSPTYSSTSLGRCWREYLYYCPRQIIRKIYRSRGNMYIEHVGDRLLYFKSADNPDSLRGEGLSTVWLDEPAEMKKEVWDYALLPALMDMHGDAWFTGTPKGMNWYHELFTRGEDPLDPEVASWHWSSYENTIERGGYLPTSAIDEIAANMTPLARRQEIMAEFVEGLGTVFRKVDSHINDDLSTTPVPGRRYVVGCDVAKYEDYTVLIALDASSGQLRGFDRFQELDWVFQRRRIINFIKRYANARLLIDSTGVGDPIFDELRRSGLSVDGYKFTNATKADLVENLSLMLDNDALSYPRLPVLTNELKLFGYERTPSGVMRYRAPEGYHDDTVMALGLAAWMLKRPTGFAVSLGR